MNILAGIILVAHITFGLPVHDRVSLAGNFGEPRPNHFHGGIDIKTDGKEGKPVFSIGDGFVSQVTIGVGGYGNAVYIHHPEGYTSVYCHLHHFMPQIAASVRKWQYAHNSDKGTMVFPPATIPIARGKLIAASGNTGSSQAPHLHLEIHETRSGNLMDPLQFLGDSIQDDVPPKAYALMVYPFQGEGVVNGSSDKQDFSFPSHRLTNKLYAWGMVGFGISANDFMQTSSYNRYGIFKTELFVDHQLVFRAVAHGIPSDEQMQVNAWGDRDYYLRKGIWFMKSFALPGVTLPIFTFGADRGIIHFNQERNYHLTYVLTDFKGNTSTYTLTVTGKKMSLGPKPELKNPLYALCWNRANNFQLPGMQLIIGEHALAEHVELKPKIIPRPRGWSDAYRLFPTSLPLFHYAKLILRVRRPVADTTKLYVVSHDGGDHYMGGTYHRGWITGKARELGAVYELAYDDTPPLLNPVGQSSWNSTHVIRMGIVDSQSGIASYQGYVDGQFVLFEEVRQSPWVRCDLTATPLKRSGKWRHFTFIAIDHRNNRREFKSLIKY